MIPQRSTTTTMSYATSSPTIAGLADADAEKHGRICETIPYMGIMHIPRLFDLPDGIHVRTAISTSGRGSPSCGASPRMRDVRIDA